MIIIKCGHVAVGAGGSLKHFVTVDCSTRNSAGIGVQGVIELDRISFPKVCGISAAALRIAPKTDYAFS